LVEDLEAEYVLADGLIVQGQIIELSETNAVPVIADSPRRRGKGCKVESDVLLRAKRYLVE